MNTKVGLKETSALTLRTGNSGEKLEIAFPTPFQPKAGGRGLWGTPHPDPLLQNSSDMTPRPMAKVGTPPLIHQHLHPKDHHF